MARVIDEQLRAFLERGCALIVGTAGPDLTPHAQRAWGCSVVGPDEVRLLLDGSDLVQRGNLEGGGRIAVTSADVRDLRSVQLKGRVVAIEEDPTADDLDRCEVHNDELFTDIEVTDHFPRTLVERMIPRRYVVAVVHVEELYDQTPGPSAGNRVTGGLPA